MAMHILVVEIDEDAGCTRQQMLEEAVHDGNYELVEAKNYQSARMGNSNWSCSGNTCTLQYVSI